LSEEYLYASHVTMCFLLFIIVYLVNRMKVFILNCLHCQG
jgi:hypothetical protein